MIVGLEFGFYVPALIPVQHRTPGDPRILQVRTRRAVDLDRLRNSYLPELGETVVLPGGSDFQFRAYCTPEQWGNALLRFSLDIDYINEKNGAIDKYKDHDLYHLYEDIWRDGLKRFPTGSLHAPQSWRKGDASLFNALHETHEWKRSSQLTEVEKRAAARQWSDEESDNSQLAAIEDELTQEGLLWSTSENERKAAKAVDSIYTRGDHSKCLHPKTKNARRACRRLHSPRGERR